MSDPRRYPGGRRPPLWARTVAVLIGLVLYAAILVATLWLGDVIDRVLTAQLGSLQSDAIAFTTLATLTLCYYDRWWAQPRCERKTEEQG